MTDSDSATSRARTDGEPAEADGHDPHDEATVDETAADEERRVVEIDAGPADADDEHDDDDEPTRGGDEVLADLPLDDRIEALLLSSGRPLSEPRLASLLGLPARGAAQAIRRGVDRLNEHYRATGRSFSVEKVAGGLQVMTRPEFGPLMDRLHADRQQAKLSPAALETLSIVAYRQPVLRAEIEAVRGVASGEVLRGLMERRLVRITGRSEVLGRPMLYGTTPQFLKVFGLGSIDDLPEVEGLERKRRRPPARAAATDAPEAADDAEETSVAEAAEASSTTTTDEAASGTAPADDANDAAARD